MAEKNYNNEFFGWYGSISRKNYAINMLIVFALYILLSFVKFNAFEQFIPIKFIFSVLVFMVGLFKLVLIMCALSLVYRRIADFAGTKPYSFQLNMKRLFVFLYVVPALYLMCVRYFFEFFPLFINFMDLLTFFILIPLSFISAIVFGFIKSVN